MPISEPAQREFLRLLLADQDQIPDIPPDAKEEYLYTISYRDFLSKHLNIREPEVFAVLQDLTSDSGVGIEATPAMDALSYTGLPGWDASGLPETEEVEPYIYHFPDGNASIARLLVREMIPAVAPGITMDDVVTARFDYSKLDRANSPVRLRLESTVVGVQHDGDPNSAKRVHITYVRGGRAYRVQARSCVLACDNAMIPYLCPELPAPQREALALQIKTPMLYTTVALRNWAGVEEVGDRRRSCTRELSRQCDARLPVSLGGYSFAKDPDDPIAVHMERFPHRANRGLTLREQSRIGRLATCSPLPSRPSSAEFAASSPACSPPADSIRLGTSKALRSTAGPTATRTPGTTRSSTPSMKRTMTSVIPTCAPASVSAASRSRTPIQARTPCSTRRSNRATAQSPNSCNGGRAAPIDHRSYVSVPKGAATLT